MKEFLSRKGIPFAERDVSRDPNAAAEMMQRSGQRGVPVILVDDHVVVGFDQARLETLLSAPGAARPSLGASVADAFDILSKRGAQPRTGAYVGRVRGGSAAERAGLRPGDIIVGLDGRSVQTAADVTTALESLRRGARVELKVIRDGTIVTVEPVI